MSGATAAYRIVSRELVTFSPEEDDDEDVVTDRTRNSWSPKVTTGAYETIRPDPSNPMEEKSVRRTTAERRPYPTYLAKIFVFGVAVFLIGCTLFIASLALKKSSVELVAWIALATGASAGALALLRAQDLVRRQS